MELREWLIILGLALVTIIVVDGMRRLQRQRRVPRLDQVAKRSSGANRADMDLDDAAKEAEINWELPNGGARVVRPALSEQVSPKPKLQRQEHPGASRVLSEWRAEVHRAEGHKGQASTNATQAAQVNQPAQSDQAIQHDQATQSDQATQERGQKRAGDQMPEAHIRKPEAVSSASSAEDASSAENANAAVAAAEQTPAPATAATTSESRRTEPTLSALDSDSEHEALSEPLAADPEDHNDHHDLERYRLVDLEGMTDSLKERSTKVGASMQRFGVSMKKSLAERKEQRKKHKLEKARVKAERQAREASRRKQAEAEKAARLAAEREQEAARQAALREQQGIDAQDQDDPLFAPSRLQYVDSRYQATDHKLHEDQQPVAPDVEAATAAERLLDAEAQTERPVVAAHPVVEKALRHDVNVEHARDTLSHAEEVIVISVMSRDEQGFSGEALLDLMLACGLRYSSDMGIFNRFETEDTESELQFSMVNVVKPGTFPVDTMSDFRTPGVTLLMPLPGAVDTAAAFEAMVETAMVVVRHLGGELKDENRSVMTAQTVEFARQRVQEFERRHRLHRYQVN